MTRAIRSKALFAAIVVVLTGITLGLGLYTITNLDSRVKAANDRNAQKDDVIAALVEDIEAERENSQVLYDQLLALGETPEGEEPGTTFPPRDGIDGRDAPPVTAAELLFAVSTCFSSGVCTAPAGVDGTSPPPLTPDQLQAAVAACFASGICTAPSGSNGQNGQDGRGIVSLACVDSALTVTYTDGITAIVGQCTPPEPPPTPAPEDPDDPDDPEGDSP